MITTTTIHEQLLSLQGKLYSYALSMTCNKEEAEDLLQDTTLRALDNSEKFAANTNFKAWVFTLMKNVFINNYRKMVREHKYVVEDGELYCFNLPGEDGFSSPESAQSLNDIMAAVNSLEEELKSPFTLHVLGYKYNEISEKLNIPIGTVKSRIFGARKVLMNQLKDYAN